ncbi:MAG: Hsp70 family protein [Verrucomicrobiota bacterium]
MAEYFGIDLGTSNCAIAKVGDDGLPDIVPLTQVVTAHGLGEKTLLPSSVYIPSEGEFSDGGPQLPWRNETGKWFAGTFARERGALQPDRLISSAKSWLCHAHADRRGPILPWGSESVSEKWSPLEVSRQLLVHLLESVKYSSPAATLDPAHVVITVPASFDEAARGLTLEAAKLAGLGEVTLLEEPQAAFYAWLESHESDWRKQVSDGDLILVCDVGGGTADFSLISVSGKDGNLALERVAVGEHLLLGGDNMDLALAHVVSEKLGATGVTLDAWQFLSLIQTVRDGKETLLSNPNLLEVTLAIPSRSRKLLAGTVSATLTKAEVQEIVVDGFFPIVERTASPLARRPGGLREAGLPYAADAAISKHLARFLARAQAARDLSSNEPGGILLPNAVLFNGGVFNARALKERVLEILSLWSGKTARELEGAQPDHAVAVGAAVYARLRQTGKGLRIKSGTAKAYYIGLESSSLAVPGRRPAVKALCIAPQGMEEGSHHVIAGQEFCLYTGEVSEFRFFQSDIRAADQAGEVLSDASTLEESAKLEGVIPPPAGHSPGEEIPVRIESRVSELGNLEIYFVHPPTGEKWKLEFNVRMQ